ncbi:MAG TPA: hypothetical protein VN175_08350 [Rhizomicrobium sp.]|nr:hypothetical protein [Rhizomicrobium sp.]
MGQTAVPTPPWLDLLNALQKEWREFEIEHGRDPDPCIEKSLSEAGRWRPSSEPRPPV